MKTKKGRTEFLSSFTGMCEVFDKKYSDTLLRVYHEALKMYLARQVTDAIAKAIVICRFFPKPVDIIEFIEGGPQHLSDIAEIEAAKVLTAIKHHGIYNSVLFDDLFTQAVIHNGFGGWVKLCRELKSEDQKWFVKDFVRMYQAYRRSGVKRFDHLAGLIELENSACGYDAKPEIKCIGERKLIS